MKKVILLILLFSNCMIFPGFGTITGVEAKKRVMDAANKTDRVILAAFVGAEYAPLADMLNSMIVPALISIEEGKNYDEDSVKDCEKKIASIAGLVLGSSMTIPSCNIQEAGLVDIGPLEIGGGKKAKTNKLLAFLLNFSGTSPSSTSTSTSAGNTCTDTSTGTFTGTGTGVSPPACTTSGAADAVKYDLAFSVADAEYSRTADRMVIIDSAGRFHYYNPSANSDTSLNLNFSPLNVTVSPDGTKAAVGHDTKVTLINLPAATIAREVSTAVTARDIVMNNTYAYVSNAAYSWNVIKSITFSDGTVSNQTGTTNYPLNMVLNSAGNSIYAVSNGLSPADIVKFNITSNPPAYLYDSFYHGDYSMCSPIWIAKDASRLFTACLNTFTVSAVQASDINYAGKINGLTKIVHLDTDSSKIYLIPTVFSSWDIGDSSEYIHLYNLSNLSFISKKTLPCYVSGGVSYKTNGKFVFANNAGTEYYVIAKPDPNSGVLNDVVYKFSL